MLPTVWRQLTTLGTNSPRIADSAPYRRYRVHGVHASDDCHLAADTSQILISELPLGGICELANRNGYITQAPKCIGDHGGLRQ